MNAALLLTALFNGAWQGAALCTAALLAFRRFRSLNATTMFAVWSALLAIAIALPVANYAFAPKPYTVRVAAPSVPAPRYLRTESRMESRTWLPPVRLSAGPLMPAAQPQPSLRERSVAVAHAVLAKSAIVIWLLALIALLRLLVLARDVVRMLVARRRVRLIDAPVLLPDRTARPFRFAVSNDFTSPCVLGFSPALIVIPDDLLEKSPDALLSIVLHEREHVRRFDDVQNVIQRFIGAVAFFCPGVRIALRELALYREQICDDAAVNGTGDRVSYAMTLTGMAQWAQGRGAPVPSLIFKRKHLLHRLEVLLDSAVSHSLRMNRRFAVGAALALGLAALLVLRIQVPVIAESIVAPPPLHKPVAPKAPVAASKPDLQAMRTVQAPPAKHPNAAARPLKPEAPLVVVVATVHLRAKAAAASVLAAPAGKIVSPSVSVPANAVVFVQPAIRVPATLGRPQYSDDLLDALNAAGLRNLSVDQLIAIRNHGVSTQLIRAAVAYFGPHMSATDLTTLADHGASPMYLDTLRSYGVIGISPAMVVTLADHGVSAPLLRSAMAYFLPRPSATDLVNLSDHGASVQFIDALRAARLTGVSVADAIRLADNGVSASYVLKIRRLYPHASIDDIIRLRDAGI